MRPVKSITTQMEMLLKEYLLSRDIPEAQRCINALECPHFFHELVYEVSFIYSQFTEGFINDNSISIDCNYDSRSIE